MNRVWTRPISTTTN